MSAISPTTGPLAQTKPERPGEHLEVASGVVAVNADDRSPQGRRMRTRPVASIDRSVNSNRALWMLAEEMRKIKN